LILDIDFRWQGVYNYRALLSCSIWNLVEAKKSGTPL